MSSPPRSRRRRKLLFGALALALGTLVGVVGVEIVLRSVDIVGRNYHEEFARYLPLLQFPWEGRSPTPEELDGYLFRHRPEQNVDLGSFTVRTNRLGLRGPEVADEKPAGTSRILFLGDSVVFGWGVDEETTFVRRFEREWNADPGHRPVEVVNTALPLYDTMQQAASLRDLMPRLHPDVVVLVYVINDLEPTRDSIETLVFGKQPDPAETFVVPDDMWSWSSSALQPVLPSIAELLGTFTNLDARTAAMVGAGRTYRPELWGKGPRGWPRCQRALLEIRDLCTGANVPFLVLDHSRPPVESLPAFCRDQGIRCEPFRFTAEELGDGITCSRMDAHANGKGHDILLRRLRAVLDAQGLLPAAREPIGR